MSDPVTADLRQRLLDPNRPPIVTLGLACPYYDKTSLAQIIDDVEQRLKSTSVQPLSHLEKLGMSVLLSSAGMTRPNGDPW